MAKWKEFHRIEYSVFGMLGLAALAACSGFWCLFLGIGVVAAALWVAAGAVVYHAWRRSLKMADFWRAQDKKPLE